MSVIKRTVGSPCVCRIPIHDVPFGHSSGDEVKEENRGFPNGQRSRRPHPDRPPWVGVPAVSALHGGGEWRDNQVGQG